MISQLKGVLVALTDAMPTVNDISGIWRRRNGVWPLEVPIGVM